MNSYKKIIALCLCSMMLVSALVSCGLTPSNNTAKDTTADTSADSSTTVALPEYDFAGTDLTVFVKLPEDILTHNYREGLKLRNEEPTEEDIQYALIKYYLYSLGEKVELDSNAVVEDGDSIKIDFTGKLDGVAFDGGTATDYSHSISLSNSTMIDGFDAGIIGMKAGETKDIEATFPDPYQNNPDLAGKTAVFTITVKEITRYTYPELTDKLITDNPKIFGTEATTAAAFKEEIVKALSESYKAENEELIIDAVWTYLLDSSEYIAYPEGLVEGYVEAIVKNYEISYKTDINTLAVNNGYLSGEAFVETYVRPQAQSIIKERLVLNSAIKLLELNITDEEAEKEIKAEYEANKEYFAMYGITSYETYLDYMGGISDYKDSMYFYSIAKKLGGLLETE